MEIRIDRAAVDRCRTLAAAIVAPVEEFIDGHSTVSVERAVLRLLGVDGVGRDDVPAPNLIVDSLTAAQRSRGVALAFGRAIAETGLTPATLGEAIAGGSRALADFDDVPDGAATPARCGRTSRRRSHTCVRAAPSAVRCSNVFRRSPRRCCT